MGCATSKQERCRHCKTPSSPAPRSYSMHVHHPPQSKGDSYHVVALTSSTIGSLKVQISNQPVNNSHTHPLQPRLIGNGDHKLDNRNCDEIGKIGDIGNLHDGDDQVEDKKVLNKEELTMGIIEAKTWSTMIDQKIPKIIPRTPIRTPPGEPETINTWELMEGLEDAAPISPHHYRSISFNFPPPPDTLDEPPKSSFQFPVTGAVGKPLWLQMADEEETNATSGVSEFDPEIIASLRNSLDKTPPAPDYQLRSNPEDSTNPPPQPESLDVTDEKKPKSQPWPALAKPKEAEKVVLYFTSLRGVRKTYEDCCHVRMILKGIGVRVDERDVSMHSGFKEELRELMGEGFGRGGLPRVFIGARYIGGAEEIRRMHEDGQLEKFLDRCEKVDDDGGCGGGVCEGCGDVRFVPCETCSGSCKIYCDIDEDEEEMEGEAEDYGFQRCPDCNENGLVRCPFCCY